MAFPESQLRRLRQSRPQEVQELGLIPLLDSCQKHAQQTPLGVSHRNFDLVPDGWGAAIGVTLLFPNERMQELRDYLYHRQCNPRDIVIEYYAVLRHPPQGLELDKGEYNEHLQRLVELYWRDCRKASDDPRNYSTVISYQERYTKPSLPVSPPLQSPTLPSPPAQSSPLEGEPEVESQGEPSSQAQPIPPLAPLPELVRVRTHKPLAYPFPLYHGSLFGFHKPTPAIHHFVPTSGAFYASRFLRLRELSRLLPPRQDGQTLSASHLTIKRHIYSVLLQMLLYLTAMRSDGPPGTTGSELRYKAWKHLHEACNLQGSEVFGMRDGFLANREFLFMMEKSGQLTEWFVGACEWWVPENGEPRQVYRKKRTIFQGLMWMRFELLRIFDDIQRVCSCFLVSSGVSCNTRAVLIDDAPTRDRKILDTNANPVNRRARAPSDVLGILSSSLPSTISLSPSPALSRKSRPAQMPNSKHVFRRDEPHETPTLEEIELVDLVFRYPLRGNSTIANVAHPNFDLVPDGWAAAMWVAFEYGIPWNAWLRDLLTTRKCKPEEIGLESFAVLIREPPGLDAKAMTRRLESDQRRYWQEVCRACGEPRNATTIIHAYDYFPRRFPAAVPIPTTSILEPRGTRSHSPATSSASPRTNPPPPSSPRSRNPPQPALPNHGPSSTPGTSDPVPLQERFVIHVRHLEPTSFPCPIEQITDPTTTEPRTVLFAFAPHHRTSSWIPSPSIFFASRFNRLRELSQLLFHASHPDANRDISSPSNKEKIKRDIYSSLLAMLLYFTGSYPVELDRPVRVEFCYPTWKYVYEECDRRGSERFGIREAFIANRKFLFEWEEKGKCRDWFEKASEWWVPGEGSEVDKARADIRGSLIFMKNELLRIYDDKSLAGLPTIRRLLRRLLLLDVHLVHDQLALLEGRSTTPSLSIEMRPSFTFDSVPLSHTRLPSSAPTFSSASSPFLPITSYANLFSTYTRATNLLTTIYAATFSQAHPSSSLRAHSLRKEEERMRITRDIYQVLLCMLLYFTGVKAAEGRPNDLGFDQTYWKRVYERNAARGSEVFGLKDGFGLNREFLNELEDGEKLEEWYKGACAWWIEGDGDKEKRERELLRDGLRNMVVEILDILEDVSLHPFSSPSLSPCYSRD
ncbi:hypothetical protein JCM16303_003290 [Sporobolomyces ruberrimus]